MSNTSRYFHPALYIFLAFVTAVNLLTNILPFFNSAKYQSVKSLEPNQSNNLVQALDLENSSNPQNRINQIPLEGSANSSPDTGSNKALQNQIDSAYAKRVLGFEQNKGQTDASVKFLARGQGYNLFLTTDYLTLDLQKRASAKSNSAIVTSSLSTPSANARLKMKLVGANPNPQINPQQLLSDKNNYFIGNDPTKWLTEIESYARIEYKEVYPGIDLIFYSNQQGQLEYDFVVAPGADPSLINLTFEGSDQIEINSSGEVVLHLGNEEIKQLAPLAYQNQGNGQRQELNGQHVTKGEGQLGFKIDDYDHSKPLVIDPVLLYSSYLGGTGADVGRAIAADKAGTVYIVGETTSLDFPAQRTSDGGKDIFLVKFDTNFTSFYGTTYIAGSGDDIAYGVTVNDSGQAFLVGSTNSPNFPRVRALSTNPGAGINLGQNGDAFLMELDTNQGGSSSLVYSTYLGGEASDVAYAVAYDGTFVYLTGATASNVFPATPNRPAGGPYFGVGTDAFVSKFDLSQSFDASLVDSYYLGGNNYDEGRGIAVDRQGSYYVTGYTRSTNYWRVNALFGNGTVNNGTGEDAFITKFDTSGNMIGD